MAQASAKALQTSLNKLQISTDTKPTTSKTSLAESWEDEDTPSSSDTETAETPPASAIALSSSHDIPAPPPPTPAAPSTTLPWTSNTLSKTNPNSQYHSTPPYGFDGTRDDVPSSSSNTTRKSTSNADDKRPEKSTAVASRLIAAGIGQKAPKRTKEQREYDQAMKVQEKKKRDAAKAEEERRKAEREKAMKDVWGD